jgi:glycosyltransferase involved in cell wall biosynthesis
LLRSAAERLPGGSFLLVGPEQTDLSILAALPNMHRLGPRSHVDVARYANAFDVAIIPYVITEYTQNVYPTKLNEYLAMGNPVVATALDEITRFNAQHGAPVAIARDAEEFAARLVQAVQEDDDAQRAERVRVAEQNGWRARVEEMSALIARHASRNREARATRWQETLLTVYRRVRRKAAATVVALGGA